MSLSHEDQVFRLVFITIGNLDAKMCQSQNQPSTLFLGLILIIYKQIRNLYNKDKDLILSGVVERQRYPA